MFYYITAEQEASIWVRVDGVLKGNFNFFPRHSTMKNDIIKEHAFIQV